MMDDATGRTRRGAKRGKADVDAGMIWIAEQRLANRVPIDVYVRRAERAGDWELARFARRVLATARPRAGRAGFKRPVGS